MYIAIYYINIIVYNFFFYFHRCLWVIGRGAHRVTAGKVAVRLGGVLPDAISQSTDQVRQAVAQVAIAAHGQLASDRTIILRPTGG